MNNSDIHEQRGPLTARTLRDDNRIFNNTGGVSAGNRTLGFRPAFKNTTSGKVYLSRFADGRPAPIHVLEGLPKGLMQAGDAAGKVIDNFVIAGFVLKNTFYTREEVANAVASKIAH